MKTVIEIWNEYARILPVTCSQTQMRETKRAFLSGMFALDTALNEVSSLPEDESVEALDRIKRGIMLELLVMVREDWPGSIQ